jgi:hypothetical protein
MPLMVGSMSVGNYVDDVVGELRRMMGMNNDDGTSWPCVILDRHIGPTELGAIFTRTADQRTRVCVGFDVTPEIVSLFDKGIRLARYLQHLFQFYSRIHLVVRQLLPLKNISPACMTRMA